MLQITRLFGLANCMTLSNMLPICMRCSMRQFRCSEVNSENHHEHMFFFCLRYDSCETLFRVYALPDYSYDSIIIAFCTVRRFNLLAGGICALSISESFKSPIKSCVCLSCAVLRVKTGMRSNLPSVAASFEVEH